MGRNLEQIEKETQSTVKLVLSEMELLAALPPEEACAPDAFNASRRRVVRKIWNLMKEALTYATEDNVR